MTLVSSGALRSSAAPSNSRYIGVVTDAVDVANRILIIENQVLLANVLAIGLRPRGFEVETIAGPSVASVVERVRVLSPVVVLLGLDLGPPLGTGLDLIGPVRGAGGRVLMMTGVHDAARLAACIQAGAIGIVDKSGSFDDLVGALCHAVAGGQVLSDDERQDRSATRGSIPRLTW